MAPPFKAATCYRNRIPVGLDYIPGDGQSQTCAACPVKAGLLNAVEALENVRKGLAVDLRLRRRALPPRLK